MLKSYRTGANKTQFIFCVFALVCCLLPMHADSTPIQADSQSVKLSDPNFCPIPVPTDAKLWDGQIPSWKSGRPLVKVALDDDAVCNDGSPAAMFVRPAPNVLPNGDDNPHKGMYHIHLKGGGSCRTFLDCQQRYCTTGGARLDKPGLMSSKGWASHIQGEGLFAEHRSNRFAWANQVLVGYCSSDTWIGSAPAGTAISSDPALPSLQAEEDAVSQIAFMGAVIVDEVLARLDAGVVVDSETQYGVYNMPPLTEASQLLWTGDSGGANGARHHVDRVAARYSNAKVVAALDAGGAIDMSNTQFDYSPYSDFDSFMEARYQQVRSFFGTKDSALDASCIASGGTHECINGYRLMHDHITTPTLARVSLADNQTVKAVERLIPVGAGPTAEEVTRQLAYNGLRTLASTNPIISVLGANCSQHVTFRNNRQYRNMIVDGTGPTLHRALSRWVKDCFSVAGCTQVVSVAPPTLPTVSTCR